MNLPEGMDFLSLYRQLNATVLESSTISTLCKHRHLFSAQYMPFFTTHGPKNVSTQKRNNKETERKNVACGPSVAQPLKTTTQPREYNTRNNNVTFTYFVLLAIKFGLSDDLI